MDQFLAPEEWNIDNLDELSVLLNLEILDISYCFLNMDTLSLITHLKKLKSFGIIGNNFTEKDLEEKYSFEILKVTKR